MFSFFSRKFPTIVLIVLLLGSLACFSGRQGRSDTVKIQGGGSSFVNPLMQKWVSEYGNINPNIRIDYQSIGSGGGIKQTRDRTLQFGATDVAINDEEMRAADS
jgi:phosphate transport system substrate-binding protein